MLVGITLLGYSIYSGKILGSQEPETSTEELLYLANLPEPCSSASFGMIYREAALGHRLETKVREMFNCFSNLVGRFEELQNVFTPFVLSWLHRKEVGIREDSSGGSVKVEKRNYLELDGLNRSGSKVVQVLSSGEGGAPVFEKIVKLAPIVAFEYQGPLHYAPPGISDIKDLKTFVRDSDLSGYYNKIRNDDAKKEICKERGVVLIIIPYTVPVERLPDYVMSRLLDHALLKSEYTLPEKAFGLIDALSGKYPRGMFTPGEVIPKPKFLNSYLDPQSHEVIMPEYMEEVSEPERVSPDVIAKEIKSRRSLVEARAKIFDLEEELKYGGDRAQEDVKGELASARARLAALSSLSGIYRG